MHDQSISIILSAFFSTEYVHLRAVILNPAFTVIGEDSAISLYDVHTLIPPSFGSSSSYLVGWKGESRSNRFIFSPAET